MHVHKVPTRITTIVWDSIGAQVREIPFHRSIVPFLIGILTPVLLGKCLWENSLIIVKTFDSFFISDKHELDRRMVHLSDVVSNTIY